MLIKRVPWARQGGARIDAGRSLASGLAFAWTGNRQNTEAVTGSQVDVNATSPAAANVQSTSAVAAQCTTGQRNIEWSRQFISTSDGAGGGDFTMLVVANPAAGGAINHLFAQKNDAGGTPFAQVALLANSNTSAGSAASGQLVFFTFNSAFTSVASAGAIDGNWHVFVGRRVGTALTVWSDGKSLASASGTLRTITQSAQRYTAIGSRGNGTADAYGGQVALAYGWNRGLQDGEIREISRNPWQLFEPRRIWVPVSAGGGTTDASITAATGVATASTLAASSTAASTPTAAAGAATASTVAASSTAASAITSATGAATASTLTGSAVVAGGMTAAAGVGTASTLTGSSVAAGAITAAAGSATANTITGTGLTAGASAITPATGAATASTMTGASTAAAAITPAAGAATGQTLVPASTVSSASMTPAAGTTTAATFAASAAAASVAIAAAGASSAQTMAATAQAVAAINAAAGSSVCGTLANADAVVVVLGSLAGSTRKPGAIRSNVQTAARSNRQTATR